MKRMLTTAGAAGLLALLLIAFDLTPTSAQPQRERRDCRVDVVLTNIHYGGADVGDDWQFRFQANQGSGGTWTPDPPLAHGESRDVGAVVATFTQKKSKPGTVPLALTVFAEEIDFFVNDHGRTDHIEVYDCPSEPGGHVFTIVARVPEFTSPGVPSTKIAEISFTFRVTLC